MFLKALTCFVCTTTILKDYCCSWTRQTITTTTNNTSCSNVFMCLFLRTFSNQIKVTSSLHAALCNASQIKHLSNITTGSELWISPALSVVNYTYIYSRCSVLVTRRCQTLFCLTALYTNTCTAFHNKRHHTEHIKQLPKDAGQLKGAVRLKGRTCTLQWQRAGGRAVSRTGRGQRGVDRKSWQAWEQEDERLERGVWIMEDNTHTYTYTHAHTCTHTSGMLSRFSNNANHTAAKCSCKSEWCSVVFSVVQRHFTPP